MTRRQNKAPDSTASLGEWLRGRRQARGLSLKDVAEISAKVSRDSAGRISHPYLSQIESGRITRPRLPKLLTLAAVYQEDIETVIDRADAAWRERLLADLAAWKEEGRYMPEPVGAFIASRSHLSRRQEELAAFIDGRLAITASDVAIPYSDQGGFKDVARNVVVAAAMLPYLRASDAGATAAAFWSLFRDYARDMHRQTVRRPIGWPWQPVADEFVRWMLDEPDSARGLLDQVSAWTLSAKTAVASVHFKSPSVENVFGFDAAPCDFVRDVRIAQIATVLASHHPNPDELPPPPDYTEAIRKYIVDVFLGRSRLVDDPDAEYPPLSVGFRAVADFTRIAPELLEGEGPAPDVQATVLRFVSAAADQVRPLLGKPDQAKPRRRKR